MEVHQALQAAMDKLQQRFTSLMQEKVDLKERVEELEHRCIQLSGETDTIGEAAVLVTDGMPFLQRPLGFILMRQFLWRSSRGVHCPVPEPACNHEAEAPREGAVHQHAGPGQGGDEGTAKRRTEMLDSLNQQCHLLLSTRCYFLIHVSLLPPGRSSWPSSRTSL